MQPKFQKPTTGSWDESEDFLEKNVYISVAKSMMMPHCPIIRYC